MSNRPVYQAKSLNGGWEDVSDKEHLNKRHLSGVYRTRILYPASAYESLQKENEAQAKRIAELEKENFSLAAGQCIYKNGLVGDEYGNAVCTKNYALEKVQDALEKTIKHFTKTPSTLEDSNVRCFAHEALAASKNLEK